MSRTRRRQPSSYFRRPVTQSTRAAELAAAEHLADEGYTAPPRLAARGNPSSASIPSAYDDLHFAQYLRHDAQRRR